jgi:rare lipoprotein A (peptidoglycan hydrolase)
LTTANGSARRSRNASGRTICPSKLAGLLLVYGLAAAVAGCATAPIASTNTAPDTDLQAGLAPAQNAHSAPSPKNSRSGAPVKPRKAVASRIAPGGGYQKLGEPYRIAGKLYVPQRDPNYDETGVASWYGRQFHGRLTANGERFDMNSLSAAHPTMPLPAYARVTNLANGRSVIVRVNDRGPFAHDRLIDLSRKTAAVLDFKSSGTARVRVQFVGDAPLHGKDENYLVASYRGPGPGPTPRGPDTATVLAAYSPPPKSRPSTAFPEAMAEDRLDRATVESGTPFDPSRKAPRGTQDNTKTADSSAVRSSYTANDRVSLAFTAIDGSLR